MAYAEPFDQTALRAEIVKATKWLRGELEQLTVDSGRFTLKIIVEGSIDKADAALKFNFDLNRNYGTSVDSPNLADAVRELLRRMGFDRVHQAELLTYDADEAERLAGLQAPTPAPPAAT